MKKAVFDFQTGVLSEVDMTPEEVSEYEKRTAGWDKELERLLVNPLEIRLAKLEDLLNQALARIEELEKKQK